MKNLLSLLLSAVIILSGLTFAYADDPEEALPPSSGASAYSVEEQSFIDQASDDTDRDLRTLSVEVVRAASSTYSLDDIYNLLISVYTTYTGRASWAVFDQTISDKITNNFSHYDSATGNTYDTGAMLWLIRNILNNIQSQLVPAASSSLPSIYELIDDINTAISDYLSDIRYGLIDSNNTPYLVNIYNKLSDIESGSIDYTSALFYNSIGVAEYASRINSAIVASYNGLHTKLGVLDNIDSKLSTTNSTLNIKLTSLNTHAQSIENKIDNQTTTISSDLSSSGAIASSISSLNNDINNISWISFGNVVASGLNSNINDYISTGSYTDPLYLKVNINNLLDPNNIIKISLPIRGASDNDLKLKSAKLTLNNAHTISNLDVLVVSHGNNILSDIYIYNFPYFAGQRYYVILEFDNQYWVTSSDSSSYIVKGINGLNQDFLSVYDFMISTNYYNLWKDIYASDDIIAAKEDQQAFEDQALGDFVGSGSASVTLSDLGTAKDVALDSASSLNTGVGASSALSVLSPSTADLNEGGLFHWFTQDNSDHINNYVIYQYQPTRSSGDNILPDIFSGSVYDRINNPQSRND